MDERDEVLLALSALRKQAEDMAQAAEGWEPQPGDFRTAVVGLATMAAGFAGLIEVLAVKVAGIESRVDDLSE